MRVTALALLVLAACGGESSANRDDPRADGNPTGRTLVAIPFDRWIGAEIPLERSSRAETSALLLRWWTDDCAFCEASLPAIEELRREWSDAGLEVAAVYHPKPQREVQDTFVEAAARERGYNGTLVVDETGRALESVWPVEPFMSSPSRTATSVTLLLDADGVVRFAHAGPELHPPRDGATARAGHEQCAREYAELGAHIRALLKGSG